MAEVSFSTYVEGLYGGEDDLLRSIRADAEAQGIPLIQIPPDLGRLLTVLIAQVNPHRILEIGTLFGYSTIFMGRAMPPQATILSLELNPVHARTATRNVERAGLGERVEIRHGPAIDTLSTLVGEQFDFVFIDADKPSYLDYLEASVHLTRPGGMIVADNVWRRGGVSEPVAPDENSAAMARFNRQLARDTRLVSTLVATKDGADAAAVAVKR